MKLLNVLRHWLVAGVIFATPAIALAAQLPPVPPPPPVVRCYVDDTLSPVAVCVDEDGKKSWFA
jgi:hypothetical protein